MTERLNFPAQFGNWPKNERETVRVLISEFEGRCIIDARVWYRDKAGELKPSRRGLTLDVKHVGPLADALYAALVAARKAELVKGSGKFTPTIAS
jgi:hypothetical protein